MHDGWDLDIFQQPWGYSAGEDGRGQLSGTDLSGLSYGDAVAERKNLDNRIGFGGYMWDPWLGAYHVRHRVYDPNLRRWLQVDPIGYAGGDWDLSRYCNGDPVNFVDPMGLWAWDGDWIQHGLGGLLGTSGGGAAADGWGAAGTGAVNVARGVGHAAMELVNTVRDIGGNVAETVTLGEFRYDNRSSLMQSYGNGGTWGEVLKTGAENAGSAATSLGTFGLSEVVGGIITFTKNGDAEGLSLRMGGVIFQNVTIVVGEAGAKFVKDASGKIVGKVTKEGKVEPTPSGSGQSCGAGEAGTVIGKMKDIGEGSLRSGERTLLDKLTPDLGDPRANWTRNSSVLREAMKEGKPIRDGSVNPNGTLRDNTGFLRMERNLLENRGWTYDPTTTTWNPPTP